MLYYADITFSWKPLQPELTVYDDSRTSWHRLFGLRDQFHGLYGVHN